MGNDGLVVCENCLRAIESREGNQPTLKMTYDFYDALDATEVEEEPIKECCWCKELFEDGQEVYLICKEV